MVRTLLSIVSVCAAIALAVAPARAEEPSGASAPHAPGPSGIEPSISAAGSYEAGSITSGDGPLIEFEPLDRILRGAFVDPFRIRYERREDADLREDLPDRDTRTLAKLGFGIDARPIDLVRGRFALRATRSWDRNVVNRDARLDPFGQDRLDLFEGFVEAGAVDAFPLGARVGRQEIELGEGRLFAANDFVQNSRSWDAVRLLWRSDGLSVDAWWGRAVLFEGYDDRNANRPVNTTDVFGLYGSLRLLDETLTVEPFYIVKYDDDREIRGEEGDTGHHLLLHSPGARAVWKPLPFILWADAMVQVGRNGPDEIMAYGLVGKAAWRAPEWLRPLFEVESEFVYGSGDRDPADGRRETLDNLFGGNHKFYGELDLASWQNIQDWRTTVRLELYRAHLHAPPPERDESLPPRYVWQRAEEALAPHTIPFTLEVGWHFLWLATPADAWYDAGRRTLRTDPTGRAPRDVGQELDIIFRVGKLSLTVAQLWTGGYVERTTPAGGKPGDPQLFMIEYAVSF